LKRRHAEVFSCTLSERSPSKPEISDTTFSSPQRLRCFNPEFRRGFYGTQVVHVLQGWHGDFCYFCPGLNPQLDHKIWKRPEVSSDFDVFLADAEMTLGKA
jgi:hypothetical protein